MGGQDPCEWAILRERGHPNLKYGDSLPRAVQKMAEPMKTPYAAWTPVGPRKHVLDEGKYWRHLANTTEPSMYGGDAAFLSNYFHYLLSSLHFA